MILIPMFSGSVRAIFPPTRQPGAFQHSYIIIKLCLTVFTFALAALFFLSLAQPVVAQNAPLILLSDANSTRAIAVDSVAFTKEPFAVTSLISWGADRRTRVVLFALNLETTSVITADAEDSSHQHHNLEVEYAAAVPGQKWMSAITLRLSDDLSDVGDVLVRITENNRQSNRVRIGIGHVGGGPPDDPGATPTSPFLIRGAVTEDNSPLANALLTLVGNGSQITTSTDENGEYLLATVAGDYALSANKIFYDFSPASRNFTNLSSAFDQINFAAIKRKGTVLGVIRNETGGTISGIEIALTGQGSNTRKLTTASDGSFLFNDLQIGFAYTVTPINNRVFTFTPKTISLLTESTSVSFHGVRRLYSISGQVLDGTTPISGATVTLNETKVATTDAAGIFRFSGIAAGFDYSITISHDDYLFESSRVLLSALDQDHQLTFKANPQVFLHGQVVDETNRGVMGVKISITGTQTSTATTKTDGTYAVPVTAVGNYSLQPWKEQDYYAFTPAAISLTAARGSRLANFKGVLNSSVTPSRVLEFDGAPKTVDYSMTLPGPDYNLFWPDGLDFGHFFWEFWAMPGETAGGTYMISDGYGGAHAILFGVASLGGREPGRYQLVGDIWNGSALTYFASDEGPAPNEWGHFAAGWDGANIVVYFNGVPVGKTHWVGPRVTPGGPQGCGRLLIGGSDHSNWVGRIAQVRGFEQKNPHADANLGVFSTFAPQTVLAVDGNLLSYYFRPAETVADLSRLGQYERQHTGLIRSTANGVLFPCNGCPVPQFVIDPTAPDFSHPNSPGLITAPVASPAAAPPGALVFDSFSRKNSTYILGGMGGLSSTESGTAGQRTWSPNIPQNQPQPFGILNGRVVLLSNTVAVAWINGPTPNVDIRVDRRPGVWGAGDNTGLSFRVADANNYFFVYTSGDSQASQPQLLTLGFYNNGSRNELASGISLPSGRGTLRVVSKTDGTINVYAGALIYSSTNALLANASGAGLYNNGPGLALTNRWDNFTVFAAP